jgi:hypothetical protein
MLRHGQYKTDELLRITPTNYTVVRQESHTFSIISVNSDAEIHCSTLLRSNADHDERITSFKASADRVESVLNKRSSASRVEFLVKIRQYPSPVWIQREFLDDAVCRNATASFAFLSEIIDNLASSH